jgi:hypothetical protein
MRTMTQSVEQIVSNFETVLGKVLRTHKSPAKARAFLLKAGILEKHRRSTSGVRLAKRFR